MLTKMHGKANFLIGGQWGSEGKGAAAAYLAKVGTQTGQCYNIVTTNAGAQAGHTSVHDRVKRVVFHLPTYSLIVKAEGLRLTSYLNAGAIIDPDILLREIDEHGLGSHLHIHPNAAIITKECREAEGRLDSAQTLIASTRKGVGEALARKVLRSGLIARECGQLRSYINSINLNWSMQDGASVLVEVPQGIGLSLNGRFYPHCTSRDCTVMQAASDAGIHPYYVGPIMLVMRTFPIRVGNITDPQSGERLGYSGDRYPDQDEISWTDLGVEPEITTVTKRVRRVFSFSRIQLMQAMAQTRPQVVYLTFCDYLKPGRMGVGSYVEWIIDIADRIRIHRPVILMQHGPTTDDVEIWSAK